MPGFGTPFGKVFGGGISDYEAEIMALAEAFAPAYSTDPDSQNMAEIHGVALAIANLHAVNARLANLMIPSKMMEFLPVLEQACRTGPQPSDSLQARRAAVAAKLLGLAGNAISQINQLCATLLGASFVALTTIPSGDATSYMPGLCPGPGGFAWTSNLATLVIKATPIATADAGFLDMIRKLRNMLQDICSAYTTFVVGTEEGGFMCGPSGGTVGRTLV